MMLNRELIIISPFMEDENEDDDEDREKMYVCVSLDIE